MKIIRFVAASFLALGLCTFASAQIIIASWTFEVTTPADLNNATTYPAFNADLGNGFATAFHTSNATDWSTPGGNGSANSFSVNTWSVGDYYQFQVSTAGFQSIALSWAQVSSSAGPGTFKISYSTDGVTFLDFGPAYSVLVNSGANTWSNGTTVAATTFARDLSALGALDNDPTVYFRLTDTATTAAGGGSVTAAGTHRLDDFTVRGFVLQTTGAPAAVPEPATWGLVATAMLAVGVAARRYRSKPSASTT